MLFGGYLLVAVLIGLVIIPERRRKWPNQNLNYQAARILPKNHLMTAADLALPSALPASLAFWMPERSKLEGRYVTRELGVGVFITEDAVAVQPTFRIDPTMTHLAVEIPRDALFDAGMRVDVCGEAGCPLRDADIAAIIRPDAMRAQAILEVPISELPNLRQVTKVSQLRLALPRLKTGMDMSQPSWRQLKSQNIPEAGQFWTPVLDYVEAGKRLKLTIHVEQGKPAPSWRPDGSNECTADGDTSRETKGLPIERAPRGALIGRIGGSTADLTAGDNAMIFVVGRYCVVDVPPGKGGPLYLGVNDMPDSARKLSGHLPVLIFEAF